MQPFAYSPWMWREHTTPERTYTETDAGFDTDPEQATLNVVGYHVEAADGSIGSIDEASYDAGSAYLVVDTGPWIFGRKVLLPAGTVQRVDHEDHKVYVDRTKDQIKHSPEYDKETFDTPVYREQVGSYYGETYRDAPPR